MTALERLDSYEVAQQVKALGKPQRRFGVPPGGPIDREAFSHVANALEIWETFGIAISRWRALREGWVCLSGCARTLKVNDSEGIAHKVVPGDTICLETGIAGQVAYLALSDNPIQGVVVEVKRVVRLLASIDGLDQSPLLSRSYSLSVSSSRHGWRLNETVCGAKDLERSEPCAPGVIQCTPNGQLIIIGPDGPTIGGYARIGAVAEEDLDNLARLGFGQPFGFTN
ncbi:MAG: hypothetical protein JNK63_04930 [Chthonomonas sp.]|nr:hypothetical protein [Chthonomonas sp.]